MDRLRGAETPPTAPGDAVVIAYVGPVTLAEAIGTRPELRSYPAMEMMRLQPTASGRREAILVRIAPGVAGFGHQRAAATVEQPRPGVLLLRCTGTVPPGRYAVSCGEANYELSVQ